jgi:CheY-like chemotaxis protein
LNPTILCVDDQPAVLKVIRGMLIKTEDRFVKTVDDPVEVIPFLETHPEVDLVISDIMMPGMDGWQLLKAIRTRFPLIGVILFSSRIDVRDQNLEPGLEPDAIVAKPFERADLVRAIHAVGRMRL